jgi:hypothetical protein
MQIVVGTARLKYLEYEVSIFYYYNIGKYISFI